MCYWLFVEAHLQRARAAFLQEFRNHAVVVETEARHRQSSLREGVRDEGILVALWRLPQVRKIRDEMTEKMEAAAFSGLGFRVAAT